MGKPFAVSIQQLHDLKVDRIGYQLKKKFRKSDNGKLRYGSLKIVVVVAV